MLSPINPIIPGIFRAQQPSQDTIARALEELKQIKFDHNDVIYMRAMGVQDIFESGQDAYDFINNNNVQVKFAKFDDPKVHARWVFEQNDILINSDYKKLNDHAAILALSEAILHEAGHAKDLDGMNSIQEELNCLALNVLGHRYHKKNHKHEFMGQTSPLFTEGVTLYNKLFFDFDINKTALKRRIKEKYYDLNPDCTKHKASEFAEEIRRLNIVG